jgi:hypothetical protein
MPAMSVRETVPVLSLNAFNDWRGTHLPVFLNQLRSVGLAASSKLLCRKTKNNQI